MVDPPKKWTSQFSDSHIVYPEITKITNYKSQQCAFNLYEATKLSHTVQAISFSGAGAIGDFPTKSEIVFVSS